MKIRRSGFSYDYIQLSRWELVKLFFGKVVKGSAMVISLKEYDEERQRQYHQRIIKQHEEKRNGNRS